MKAVKNASDQLTRPLRRSPPLAPPFPPLLQSLQKKTDVSSPGILPRPWPILFFLSGPFFTLIWGWDNAPVLYAVAAKNWFAVQSHPADRRPALFAEFRPRGLLPLPKGERTAGWPLICPGEPQEDLGWGQQRYHCQNICRRVLPLV